MILLDEDHDTEEAVVIHPQSFRGGWQCGYGAALARLARVLTYTGMKPERQVATMERDLSTWSILAATFEETEPGSEQLELQQESEE